MVRRYHSGVRLSTAPAGVRLSTAPADGERTVRALLARVPGRKKDFAAAVGAVPYRPARFYQTSFHGQAVHPLFCVVIPVAIESLWACAWLPRAWENCRLATGQDVPTKLRDRGTYRLTCEMLVGFAAIIYHWPMLPLALFWRAQEPLPFWLIVAGMIATTSLYAGALLSLL